MSIKVFISSVQAEFAEERRRLFDYIQNDTLLGRFFVPFIFENEPASNYRAQAVYLSEVAECDIYLGLFGCRYGFEDADGYLLQSESTILLRKSVSIVLFSLLACRGAGNGIRNKQL